MINIIFMLLDLNLRVPILPFHRSLIPIAFVIFSTTGDNSMNSIPYKNSNIIVYPLSPDCY